MRKEYVEREGSIKSPEAVPMAEKKGFGFGFGFVVPQKKNASETFTMRQGGELLITKEG